MFFYLSQTEIKTYKTMTTQEIIDETSITLTLNIISTLQNHDELAKLSTAVIFGACARAGSSLDFLEKIRRAQPSLKKAQYTSHGLNIILKVSISNSSKDVLDQIRPLLEYGFGDTLAYFPSGLVTWSFMKEDDEFLLDREWKLIDTTFSSNKMLILKATEKWIKLIPLAK